MAEGPADTLERVWIAFEYYEALNGRVEIAGEDGTVFGFEMKDAEKWREDRGPRRFLLIRPFGNQLALRVWVDRASEDDKITDTTPWIDWPHEAPELVDIVEVDHA